MMFSKTSESREEEQKKTAGRTQGQCSYSWGRDVQRMETEEGEAGRSQKGSRMLVTRGRN